MRSSMASSTSVDVLKLSRRLPVIVVETGRIDVVSDEDSFTIELQFYNGQLPATSTIYL